MVTPYCPLISHCFLYNAAMISFIEMFTVNEEDNSDAINENDMEINPAQDDMQIDSNEKKHY